MHYYKKKFLLCFLVFCGVCFVRAQAATVQFAPSDTSGFLGDSLRIAVIIENGIDVGAHEFEIAYDPTIIRIESIEQGDFLSSNDRMTFPIGPSWVDQNTQTIVRFGQFSLGTQTGVSGDGVLAILHVIPVSIGQSALTIKDAILTNAGGDKETKPSLVDGRVTILPHTPDPTNSMIAAEPDTIPADGFSTSLITVTPADLDGNILPAGQNVLLQTTQGRLLESIGSHADGRYTQLLCASSTSGTAIVSATVNGVALATSKTVMFVDHAGTGIRVFPADTTVDMGRRFIIAIKVNNIWNLGGFEFSLKYSNQTITVDSVWLGDFLQSSGRTSTPFPALMTNDADSGHISFGAFSFGQNQGPSGSGVLAYIRCLGTDVGTTILNLSQAVLTDVYGNEMSISILGDGNVHVAHSTVDRVLSTITAEPDTIPADGFSTTTITVIPRNANGDVLPSGQIVQITATAGELFGAVTSHPDGSYTQKIRSSTKPQIATIAAKVNSVDLIRRTEVFFSLLPETVMQVSPQTLTAEIGKDFVLAIEIGECYNFGSFEFSLSFVTDFVVVDSVWLGDFISSTGRQAGTLPVVIESNTDSGNVSFGGFSFGSNKGPDGSGVLAYLRVHPKVVGQTSLIMKRGQATDSQGNSITLKLQDGLINITAQAPSQSLSRIFAVPDSIPANDLAVSSVTVIPYNDSGNVLPPGQDVQFSTTLGILLGSVVSHEDGSYTQYLQSSRLVGIAVVSASVNNIKLQKNAKIVFTKKQPLTIKLNPADTSIILGNNFYVSVSIENAWNLGGFELEIPYTTQFIEFKELQWGNFLSSSGRRVGFLDSVYTNTNETDVLRIGGFSFGPEDGPVGTGELALIQFHAKSIGMVELLPTATSVLNKDGASQDLDKIFGAKIFIVNANIDPNLSTIEVEPDSIPADGKSKALIVVTPRNLQGLLIGSGQNVVLQASAGTLLEQVIDNGDGSYFQYLQSGLTPLMSVVNASVNNVSLNNSTTVVFSEPSKVYITAPTTTQTAGDEFWVSLQLGSKLNPISEPASIELVLAYSNSPLISVLADSLNMGDYFGEPDDVVFSSKVDESNGEIEIITGIKSGSATPTGHGSLAHIKFKSDAFMLDSTLVQFKITSLSVLDSSSRPITLLTDSLIITIRGVKVWPGDTNDDGIVNHVDLLPVGLCYNQTGLPRKKATTNWIGQYCTRWNPEPGTYADANGDGQVSRTDADVVTENWGKHHDMTDGSTNAFFTLLSKESIRLDISKNENNEYIVNFKGVGDTYLAVAFKLYYPADDLKLKSIPSNNFFEDGIFAVFRANPQEGSIACALVANADELRITRIPQFVFSCQAEFRQSITFTLSEAVALTHAGEWVEFASETVDMSETAAVLPKDFLLHQNYPNPFNSVTTIEYELPIEEHVTISIYNLLGTPVRNLVDKKMVAGAHKVVWDGRDADGALVSSGLFYYKLKTPDFSTSKKCLLMK